MTDVTIDGFDYRAVPGDGGVELNVAVGGSGPAAVLLHGFPQTHLMWRHVARQLADTYQVIVPDLRGYGASDKPAPISPETYSKATMARDILGVVRSIGPDRFSLIGHDRGALVGVRAALDHPGSVTHLGILDVLPTMDTWDVLRGVDAAVAWHLYLMAQPQGLPERMIEAVAEDFFGSFLDAWDPSGTTFLTADTPALRRQLRAGDTVHRGGLPGHGHDRPRDGSPRPEGRRPAGDARRGHLPGLGITARVQRAGPVAAVGTARHVSGDRRRSLHGRRASGRRRVVHSRAGTTPLRLTGIPSVCRRPRVVDVCPL